MRRGRLCRSRGEPRFRRTGVPVTTHSLFGKYGAQARKPRSIRVAKRAVSLFARPGIALDSWMKVGSFCWRPARIGAVEVKPPIPRTTDGRNFRYAFLQYPRPSHVRRRKRTKAGESTDGMPIEGSFSARKSGCAFRAIVSISFSETISSTSCPRSFNVSATARPGKR